jgi:hypothetical protein
LAVIISEADVAGIWIGIPLVYKILLQSKEGSDGKKEKVDLILKKLSNVVQQTIQKLEQNY